jgi:hypothetical protein
MIPNLALMVGAYIGFRMIEVLLLSTSRYQNFGSRVVACILACITLLVSGIALLDIMLSGSNILTLPH